MNLIANACRLQGTFPIIDDSVELVALYDSGLLECDLEAQKNFGRLQN